MTNHRSYPTTGGDGTDCLLPTGGVGDCRIQQHSALHGSTRRQSKKGIFAPSPGDVLVQRDLLCSRVPRWPMYCHCHFHVYSHGFQYKFVFHRCCSVTVFRNSLSILFISHCLLCRTHQEGRSNGSVILCLRMLNGVD